MFQAAAPASDQSSRSGLGIRVRLLASVAAAVLLAGCAGGMSRQDAADYDSRLFNGDYKGAADLALRSGGIGADGSSNNLAWSLDAGAALTYAGDGSRAAAVLDGAETLMKNRDLDGLRNMGQYHYATYDGVMANTYKAVDYLNKGDRGNARVEFNRLNDRQRRAEGDFAAEKVRLDRQMRSKAQDSRLDLGAITQNAMQSPEYQRAAQDVRNYAGYQPFINPLSTYLYGIFMITNGETQSDVENGRRALREVRGILGGSPVVDADLALADSHAKAPHTWVVFENGQAPTFAEYRVTFPVPLIGKTRGASTVTVALPRMVFHDLAYGGLQVIAGSVSERTATVGSFDRVMASEFEQRMPGVLTRAAIEAVVKMGIEEAAAQAKSPLFSLAAAVIGNISSADTRSWTALPKQFQAVRLDTPANGKVHLRADNGADLGAVTVPTDRSSIIYVKAMIPGVPASIQVLPM